MQVLLYSVNIYANQHCNNPNQHGLPHLIFRIHLTCRGANLSGRGLTLDIIIPDVCQVPVSMLSFSRVGLVFTFCSTCKLINVVKLSLRKYI